MKSKWIFSVLIVASLGVLTGCATAPKSETDEEGAYAPPSQQPESAKEHWERRDREDQAAVAKSIADGKGP